MSGRPRTAAVAAGDRQTVDAAASVLRAGGNAVDAALGAGFAAAVAEPGLTSLGGGGFLLVRDHDGDTQLLDFFVDAPGRGLPTTDLTPHFSPVTVDFSGALQVFHAGFGSVAVPGVLSGYLTAHRELGRLPLPDVVAPAASLARRGATLSDSQATVLWLLRDILALTPTASALFLHDGQPPAAGHVFQNATYAQFLEELGELDPAGWHELPQVDALLDDMRTHDGLLTKEDLAHYKVQRRTPCQATYLGATLTTNPPPSFGGSIVCRALTELDRTTTGGRPSVSEQIDALHTATLAQKTPDATSTQGTTHVSVVDADGMIASMTTSNGSCSGVLVPGTGVQLNNMMGESDLHPNGFHGAEPGTRVASMMAPSLLDLPDGSVIALGSGGSERIRSALLQTVIRLVHGDSVTSAVADPRFHFDGTTSQLEPGVSDAIATELAARGPVHRWERSSVYFGGANAVRRRPDGSLEATGDARRDGASLVVEL
ncbi:MAG TPA: gamma-glutamyltransferase [Actinomycetes bacterium]|nr:gamma-glutamyltransferase [Actinomycetes bacterium]